MIDSTRLKRPKRMLTDLVAFHPLMGPGLGRGPVGILHVICETSLATVAS